jgi:hypothetical protein
MIEHITRQFVFDNYKGITSEIADIQKAMFDSDPLFEDGDDGKWYVEMHDALNIPLNEIKKYHSVVTFDHSNISTFTIALSEKLAKLLGKLNVSDLIVIAHMKLNFIANPDNSYQPFQEAVHKFQDITKDLTYDEAFKIDLTDLPSFVEIAFWIERCDTRSPEYIYFSDTKETIAFYLCKSGGIHFIEYGKEIVLDELIENLDMYFVNGRCKEQFSQGSKIEGRQSSRI